MAAMFNPWHQANAGANPPGSDGTYNPDVGLYGAQLAAGQQIDKVTGLPVDTTGATTAAIAATGAAAGSPYAAIGAGISALSALGSQAIQQQGLTDRARIAAQYGYGQSGVMPNVSNQPLTSAIGTTGTVTPSGSSNTLLLGGLAVAALVLGGVIKLPRGRR